MERADICKLLIGFSVGATTALLLAPYPGKNTRSKITDAAADGTAYVKGRGETVRDAVLDALEHGKVDIARHKQGLAETIKQALRCTSELSMNKQSPEQMEPDNAYDSTVWAVGFGQEIRS